MPAPLSRPLAIALVAIAPCAARADLTLLDETLRPPVVASLVVEEGGGGNGAAAQATPAPGSLDFDLLGAAQAPAASGEDRVLARRRTMLKIHQGVGLGLVALQLGTTVVGQLNYNDKFGGDANTDKYRLTHAALAYTTLGVFALNGALALFTPNPPQKVHHGFDRTTVHRISMFTAAAGMAGQAALGIYTSQREGYLNQPDVAKAHLALGYVTLAALLTGVSALVF